MDDVMVAPRQTPIQPLWLRVTHWLNVFAVLILVTSGWRIYNASPLFDFMFPKSITLGGWLGGALQWHFAAMWLLTANGIVYLFMNIVTKRMWRKFLPLTPRAIVADMLSALRGTLKHDDLRHYNAVQKAAFLCAILLLMLMVISGLAIWKSVQFPLLTALMGGFDAARYVHFFAMAALLAFIAVHVVMALLVPKSLLAIIRGR